MFRLKVKTHFDAAHHIRDYEGKCGRVHGHRWELEVVFEGTYLDDKNMLVDFRRVKDFLARRVECYLDHWDLNATLNEPNVTAEFIARWAYRELQNLGDLSSVVRLVCVTVWESPECCVSYYGGADERRLAG